MEEWKEYKISEVIDEISMGPFGSNIKVDNFIDSGVPVLNGSNLQGFKLNENSFNYVSQEKANSLGKANAHRGDVVITHRGTLGQIIYIPDDSKFEQYVISQSQFRLKLKKDLIRPDFFVYFFHTRLGQHRILMNASQVGVPALARPTSTFKEVYIPVPPMENQNKVMDILHSLDDKIEVNRRINDNLEQQAQALFKSWFVDFEPFRDQPFVESELGMIPEGWKVEKIGSLPISVTDYVANGSFASLKENVKLYQTPEYAYFIRNTDLKSGKFEVYVDRHSYEFLSKSTLYGGEIIISNVGDVGSVHLCPYLDKPMTLGNNIIMLKPNKQYYSYYLYILFKWAYGNDLIMSIKGGSAQPKFNKTDFKSLKIIAPKDIVLEKYHSMISVLFNKMRILEDESRRLAELRDTLLPRLMSGELKLNEIENAI